MGISAGGTDITAEALSYYHNFLNQLNSYISETPSVNLISIGLMLLALILFLLFIILLYIRSIALFAKELPIGKNTSSDVKKTDTAEVMDNLHNEAELEKELELLLARDLEKSKLEQARLDEADAQQKQQAADALSLHERQQLEKEKREQKLVDLDWKKNNTNTAGNVLNSAGLKYQKTASSINELTGLIMELFSRGVDDDKIAQAINYRNQGINAEEDILQTISAIKTFINMVRDGAFNNLKSRKKLPSTEEALFHLSLGDTSLALALVQARMDKEVEQALSMDYHIREQRFAEISKTALAYGNLARLDNDKLAAGAYELALELSPADIQAESRLADLYFAQGNQTKALEIYDRLSTLNPSPLLLANAKQKKAMALQQRGDKLAAAQLAKEAEQIYASSGVRQKLTPQEIEVLEIIENHPGPQRAEQTASLLIAMENQQQNAR